MSTLREGDIVFIETRSFQSKFVKMGMMSIWSHCGIAVNTPEGVQIMEADSTVRILPVERFVAKSVGGKYIIKPPAQTLQDPINQEKWLGRWYDLKFSFDNEEVYCSELVWLIYKDHGIELCPPIPIK